MSTLSEILSLIRLPTEIRDDCRADRTIARSTLLEISKMSTVEQMIALYRQYRVKGLSREKLRQSARNQQATAPRPEIRQVRSWTRKFCKFDVAQLAEQERNVLKGELEKLHKQVQQMLATLGQ